MQIYGGGIFYQYFFNNIIDAMAKGNILAVILFSSLFAVATLSVGAKAGPAKKVIQSLSDIFFRILICDETSHFGVNCDGIFRCTVRAGIFTALGKYIFTAYAACIAVFVIVMLIPTILYAKINPKIVMKGLCKDMVGYAFNNKLGGNFADFFKGKLQRSIMHLKTSAVL